MREEDVHKMAFREHLRHCEHLVMTYRLCNAPSAFQVVRNNMFRHFFSKFVLVFFDKILVYSATTEEYLRHLEEALRILGFIKLSKCDFPRAE